MCDDDLVERVARAIYENYPKGEYDANDPRTFWKSVDSYWHEGVWSAWEGQARAALASIEAAGYVVVPREPTVEMQRAGFLMLDKTRDCDCDQKDVWAAMLDAALEKDKANVR